MQEMKGVGVLDKDSVRKHLDEAIERAKAGQRLNLAGKAKPSVKTTAREDQKASDDDEG